MRYLYSFLLYIITPFILLRWWWRGRQNPAYRQRISERFCLDPEVGARCDIWIHTVSLGEVIAATPLIEALLQNNQRLLVTTTTPTGARQVQTHFKEALVHRYLPFDLPDAVSRFFKRYQPKIGLIFETEIWPNLISKARTFSVPLLLINARLSEGSFQHYKKMRFFFKPILNQFQSILTQGSLDAKRFMALGADKERVTLFGNLKFDLKLKPSNLEGALACKERLGPDRVLLIAASTHDDEERQLLTQLKSLQAQIPEIVLLIAARHPERFQPVFQLSKQLGFQTGLQSSLETINPKSEVVVIDCLGQLMSFYQIVDYAFVGGSLVPVGGHNVLEPIAMQVPVFTGMQYHNFKEICDTFRAGQGLICVNNAADFVEKLVRLHQDKAERERLVSNANQIFNANVGVIGRYMEKIESLLKGKLLKS